MTKTDLATIREEYALFPGTAKLFFEGFALLRPGELVHGLVVAFADLAHHRLVPAGPRQRLVDRLQELVRDAAQGRHHHHALHVVALGEHELHDPFDPFRIRYRRAAELVDLDGSLQRCQCHYVFRPDAALRKRERGKV